MRAPSLRHRLGPARGPATVLALAGSAATVVCASCGPSVQTIYEGTVRFEHCYRLDLDPSKAPSHRHACWRNWLQNYTYAQPSDRIDYARRRVSSLQMGDPDRPTLHLQKSESAQRSWYLSGPAPVSPHAPPPAMAEAWDAGAPEAKREQNAPLGEGPPPPAEQCNADCRSTWRTCLSGCEGDAGASDACSRCEPDYLSCMRRCFGGS